ncbi:MAG: arsenate reductase family protein [Ruminococcus sp.]|nr:arsenate reductase family protein [Ruminococcus sp.]
MNIQIFGSKKSNDSKKAERYFKERGIKLQFIDMKEKGMSRGEFDSVVKALGGFKALIDENAKDKQTLTLMRYLSDSDAEEKLFEEQHLIRLPIVRNGKQATVGYQPDIWKDWQ